MKKIVSIILIITLLFSISSIVSADSYTSNFVKSGYYPFIYSESLNTECVYIDKNNVLYGYDDFDEYGVFKATHYMDNVKAIYSRGGARAILKTNNQLLFEGYSVDDSDSFERFINNSKYTVINDVIHFAAGSQAYAVIKSDNSLWGWGSSYYNTISDSITYIDEPIKLMDDVSSVVFGGTCIAALKNDGTLWLWGQKPSTFGLALGLINKEKDCTSVPQLIMSNVRSIAGLGTGIAFITNDNTLYVLGTNSYGELGVGDTKTQKEPQKVMENVKFIDYNSNSTIVITQDDALWYMGKVISGLPVEGIGNDIKKEDRGWHGTKSVSIQTVPFKIAENVQYACFLYESIFTVDHDGNYHCFGSWNEAEINFTNHLNSSKIQLQIPIISEDLNISGNKTLDLDSETVLKATRYDENGNIAPDGGITWSCSDESIAQITPSGNKVTVKGLKGGKVTITATHAESGMSATHEIEVNGGMQISISNTMADLNGVKTKSIEGMQREEIVVTVTQIPDDVKTEDIKVNVSFDKEDFIKVGQMKEVPTIQTKETGKAVAFEIPIKGLKRGTVKFTAELDGTEKSDSVNIVIDAPKVYNNNVEVSFENTLPYIENERMFVSAENFFSQVGGSAQQNGQTVEGTHNGVNFKYIIDNDAALVNEAPATIENIPTVKTTAEGEDSYIPLRFTAENYNGYVQWNDEEYAAYITDDERSAFVSNIKKYCYNYPEGEKNLYYPQQKAYDQLVNNELYLSYWFMKEYSEIDTTNFGAFVADLGKKGIINATAMAFNGEWKDRLWQMLKVTALKDYSSLTDGVDEVEKEKYKDALKMYIESNHEKKVNDEIVKVLDNGLNPLNEAASSMSTATGALKLDLEIANNADDLKETRKLMDELGVTGAVSDYSNEVDNLLNEFDTLDVVGKIADAADYAFIIKDGVSDMIKVFGNYNAFGSYVDELDGIATNESLPAALRQAASELKTEISGKMTEVIEAPLMRMLDEAGKKAAGDAFVEIAGSIGSGVVGQIMAGVSIAAFIGNVTAGVDDIIKNISYTQMWGFLQVAEVDKLTSAVSEFNRLYKNEADIDKVLEAANKVKQSYERLYNYRLQGEQTYRYLQSGEYAIIDLQKFTNSDEDVAAADRNIKMLNEISFK